jgi:hypothetical protein
MHVGLKQIDLPEGWAIKKCKSFDSALLGHPTIPVSAAVACVGDRHWDEVAHEVIVFKQSAKEVSNVGAKWDHTTQDFRLCHWHQLKSCLQAIADGRIDEWDYEVTTSTE